VKSKVVDIDDIIYNHGQEALTKLIESGYYKSFDSFSEDSEENYVNVIEIFYLGGDCFLEVWKKLYIDFLEI